MITFSRVRYKNFLSAGNKFIELDLDKNPTTLIIGKNGSGKSAGIIDAIFFCLYGKSYRKLKKDQIINSINKKNCLVELEFSEGSTEYKIIRGIKPNIFEIYVNGVLREQDAALKDYQAWLENSVLKMNSVTMRQIVFLGSTSYIPFMKLNAFERRKVVEEILDIQIFSIMNNLLKSKMNVLNNVKKDVVTKIEMLQSKVELLEQHQLELSKQKEDEIVRNVEEIEKLELQIDGLLNQISDITEEIDQLRKTITDFSDVNNIYTEMSNILNGISWNRKKTNKTLSFFETTDICPTCEQVVEDDFKTSKVNELQNKQDEYDSAIGEIEKKLSELHSRLEEIKSTNEMINEREIKIREINTRISAVKNHLESLQRRNSALMNETDTDDKKDESERLDELRKKIDELTETKKSSSEILHYFTLISSLLKDNGIKTYIIKTYVPIINSLIRKYLEILEFNCEFSFDENFEETIKSRHRDNFAYANFSEGQKLRIDLALMFTWRELARLRNSAATNLLVLDEIGSSSLDADGTSAFMRIINEISDNTNVFVITHDKSVMDLFDNVIEYCVHNNISRIVEA